MIKRFEKEQRTQKADPSYHLFFLFTSENAHPNEPHNYTRQIRSLWTRNNNFVIACVRTFTKT